MRAGSLCSGIEGLGLAVHAALGAEPAWLCESDTHCRTVLERHYPSVPIVPDVREIDTGLPAVDLLHAGYPCQPFSQAGRRAGADDPRHLWPAVLRAVRLLRPGVVVLENVAGHLTLGFDRVLADLAEAGFDAEWLVVRASDVGAPHRRERLFVLATDASGKSRCPSVERNTAAARSGEGTATDAERKRGRAEHEPDLGLPVPSAERELASDPDEQHVRTGRGWRRAAGGDHTRADETAAADTVLAERGDEEQQNVGSAAGRATEPRERASEVAWGQYEPAIRQWEHVLGRPAPRPTDDRGRLMPEFVEWMMGFPAGWTDGPARTHRLRMLGNAVVPQQGELALRLLTDAARTAA